MSNRENVDEDQADKRLLISLLDDLTELSTVINRTHSQNEKELLCVDQYDQVNSLAS